MAAGYREAMESVISRVQETKADVVFGESRRVGKEVIIPIARVSYGWGGGMGRGKVKGKAEEGEGGGAGMGVKVLPLGFIEVKDDKTRYRPIVDVGKIAAIAVPLVMLALWRLMRNLSR